MERGDAMQTNLKQALIAYGLRQLADRTGGNLRDLGELRDRLPEAGVPDESVWEAYEQTLAGGQKRKPEEVLTCIFSLIEGDEGQRPEPCFYSALPLALDGKVLFPKARAEAQPPGPDLWQDFTREFLRIPQMEAEAFFETFYHLYQKYAWAVPCSYGEPGASLFEQWKGVAALACASGDTWAEGPADGFTLIGGDIPGIQDFVYTITSKGAAKGLRGRSFFLQLLGDAVVRRILADLDLCPANVVYNAGGNFVLLGPAGVSEAEIRGIDQAVNQVLLEHFSGDLALALGWESIPREAIGGGTQDEDNWVTAEGRLKEAIARAKRQPFARLAAEDWNLVFEPDGKGGDRYCAICRCELEEGQGRPLRDEDLTPEPGAREQLVCDDCHGFEELAQALAQEDMRVLIGTGDAGPASWQRILKELTVAEAHPGLAYALTGQSPPSGALVYTLSPDQFAAGKAHGFRWLANTTPREPAPGDPRRKQIRPVNQMANDATSGFKRVGVLRMDVDNLGNTLVSGIPGRSMLVTSGLSGALDRFFAGWLDKMIQGIMADPGMVGVGKGKPELFYTIYAGGDDLFVVGTWDRIPSLAQRIRHEFGAYTGEHSRLGLSAGISVEEAKSPIYRAAERAGEALEHGAKERHGKDGRLAKDGITFLEETYDWQEFAKVQGIAETLIGLVKNGVPRRVITLLRGIYGRWLKDRESGRATTTHPFYGPWMWLQAYALTRFKGQHPQSRADLEAIQKEVILGGKINTLGMATRWAEYLTRGGEGS
jgi:CRISPR-associated protein Csm1